MHSCVTVAGQEENLYAKKNYEKYLSALKNSGLVSVEEKAQGATADVTVGAEGGAGAMVLLGRMMSMTLYRMQIFNVKIFRFSLSMKYLALELANMPFITLHRGLVSKQ